jgi:hypothetical protein
MAGAIGRRVTGEEDDRAVEFVGLSPAAQRGALREPVALRGIGAQRRVHVVGRHHVAGRDRVDRDPLRSPLDGQCAGHALQPGLRGAVARIRLARDVGVDRRDVDDAAPAAPDHPDGGEPGEAEARIEVDAHDLVPLGVGGLACGHAVPVAGIVDEDVEMALFRLDPRDRGGRRCRVGGVEGEGGGLASGGEDRVARSRDPVHVPAIDDDARAAAREGERHGAAEATRGASHERHLAIEREDLGHGGPPVLRHVHRGIPGRARLQPGSA